MARRNQCCRLRTAGFVTNYPACIVARGDSFAQNSMLCFTSHPVFGKDRVRRAPRFKTGSVVFDRRRRIWNLLMSEEGRRRTRRIGTLSEYPSKSAARRAAQSIPLPSVEISKPQQKQAVSVRDLIERYRVERMPKRSDTRRAYEVWVRNHILPKWADCVITNLEPRPVELWLESLPVAARSKAHIRGMLSIRNVAGRGSKTG